MDSVRLVAYVIGGFFIGGIAGMGIVSVLPSGFSLSLFYILPSAGAVLGVLTAFLIARSVSAKATPPFSNVGRSTGFQTQITGWTLAILIAIGILAALYF